MPPSAPVLLLTDLEQYRSPQHTHEVYHLVEVASSRDSTSVLGMGFFQMFCSTMLPISTRVSTVLGLHTAANVQPNIANPISIQAWVLWSQKEAAPFLYLDPTPR